MQNFTIEKLTVRTDDKILVNIDRPIVVKNSLAIVGQSGSGKSTLLKALLDMLPNNLTKELKYSGDFVLQRANIGFVPQNPFTALSPMTKIYKQFFCSDSKIKKLFELVELDISLKDKFPLHLSGGQLQRVVVAIALSRPIKLLLLDEPTTALDKGNKNIVLELIKKLQEKLKFGMIFVTHDIKSIQNLCQDIVILNSGKIVEYGTTVDILGTPQQKYTQNLIQSDFANRSFRR